MVSERQLEGKGSGKFVLQVRSHTRVLSESPQLQG